MVINRMGRDWSWPDFDTQLIRVFDQVCDVEEALEISGRRTVIQAGGAVGVWPWYLSQRFEQVVTFEPNEVNFHHLQQNAPDVIAYHGALGKEAGSVSLTNGEKDNAGTWYVSGEGQIPMTTIDSFGFSDVDLICLDVEGHELAALEGAANTLDRCRPVVMLEEKPLPHMRRGEHTKAREFLESLGYRVHAHIHRDVILC